MRTSAQRLNEISVEMAKTDVIRILGAPENVRSMNGQEVPVYMFSNIAPGKALI